MSPTPSAGFYNLNFGRPPRILRRRSSTCTWLTRTSAFPRSERLHHDVLEFIAGLRRRPHRADLILEARLREQGQEITELRLVSIDMVMVFHDKLVDFLDGTT